MDKTKFLRKLLARDIGPDVMLRAVLNDYLSSTEGDRVDLVGALMTELSSHIIISRLRAKF